MRSFEGKVVGVGLGRTGSNSLCEALNHIGIRTKHFPGLLTADDLRTGRKHLTVLEQYQAIANGTGAPYGLIDREYPGSRFVLTIRRDVSRWVESKRRYAELELQNWSHYRADRRTSKRLIRERVYGSFEFDADRWRRSYEAHAEAVREYFTGRPDDLLEMDITAGDGWDVLCPFLGMSSPTIPFPHVNSLETATGWHERVAELWADLDRCIGREATFVLVDDQELGGGSGRALPFLEREGNYWGRPVDDRTAIRELERMRSMGVTHLVFVWSTLWWLDHYREFDRYLTDHYPRVLENSRTVVFDLRDRQRRSSGPAQARDGRQRRADDRGHPRVRGGGQGGLTPRSAKN